MQLPFIESPVVWTRKLIKARALPGGPHRLVEVSNKDVNYCKTTKQVVSVVAKCTSSGARVLLVSVSSVRENCINVGIFQCLREDGEEGVTAEG